MAERSFAPTAALGVLGAGLAATAGHRDWLALVAPGPAQASADWFWQNNQGIGQVPLFGALGLVSLACWGVLLVSRGVWRRLVAGLGLLAGIGLSATWFTGLATVRDVAESQVATAALAPGWSLEWTPWFFAAGLAAALLLCTGVVAVLRVTRWPAMGSRYDAPTSGSHPVDESGVHWDTDLSETDPMQVWKAIDEGRDPT